MIGLMFLVRGRTLKNAAVPSDGGVEELVPPGLPGTGCRACAGATGGARSGMPGTLASLFLTGPAAKAPPRRYLAAWQRLCGVLPRTRIISPIFS